MVDTSYNYKITGIFQVFCYLFLQCHIALVPMTILKKEKLLISPRLLFLGLELNDRLFQNR